MIKSKNTISSTRINKKLLRPHSSGANLQKKTNPHFINTVISSLERNVKDLKNYYQKEELNQGAGSKDKFPKGFRIKRGLTRNSSQSNLKLQKQDKSENDIFEIRNQYLKVNGRTTNNIIELYEFYRKNIEKRQKSTRIMASMELSNGGQSISGGKQSLLKHSQLLNHRQSNKRDKDQQRIEQKNQESNIVSASSKSPLKVRKEKTSQLANELISKGCYNIMNIANLLNCKKYRLTKQKQQSFKKPKIDKSKHLLDIIQAKSKETNKQNDRNIHNIIIEEPQIGTQFNSKHQSNQQINLSNSPQLKDKLELSDKKNMQVLKEGKTSNSKSFQCSSISKQDKDIEKRIFDDISAKKEIQNPRTYNNPKLQVLINLQESPIAAKNGKQFQKSKYYVKPLPQRKQIQNMKSISLRSSSRIIDIVSLPFEF